MARPLIQFNESKHKYLVEGEEYPSVTTIINGTVPKSLAWWGMEVGAANVCILARRGLLPSPLDPEVMVKRMQEQKITTNDGFWTRVDSGKAIHKAFENYGKTGDIPELSKFAAVDHNRIQELARFILDNRPEFIEQEVRTASLQHRYAGTFDSKVRFGAGDYQGATCMLDVKTGKYVYPESQFPQLEAYEQAEIEAGLDPTDYRLVLHLPVSGPWALHPSLDSFDDFAVLLEQWKHKKARQERMTKWRKEQKRKRNEQNAEKDRSEESQTSTA